MPEIQDWIKEQLKKGFKKEQIKDGLRKAGYGLDVIDSVDSLAKKNKQTKQLVVGLTLLLVVVIIIWLVIGNYAAKKDTNNIQQLLPFYFSHNHPTTLDERDDFVGLCRGVLSSEESENTEEILCSFGLNKEFDVYVPLFQFSISELNTGQYISIVVDLNDLIKKLPDVSEDDSFNICSMAEPSFIDPLSEEMNLEQNLIFPEGEVFCSKAFKLSTHHSTSLTGFVPQAEIFNAGIYLVPQEVIPEILNKDSFPEAKSIVESYTLLWQLKRPIVNVSLPKAEAKNEE